jgi:hypothetical protein
MKKLVLFILLFGWALSASATTHYVSAGGADTNDGLTKGTSWAHAPGMPNCGSACLTYQTAGPAAGDQIIFKGGDTWHYGTGTPLIGGTWNWTWGGTNGNPIYIGVDATWYTGGSWTRPILNGDNALSTSFVGSCTYVYAQNMVSLGASYLTFDNFEMKGVCWNSTAANIAGMWNIPGGTITNVTFTNNYCHGWTMVSTASDNYPCIQTFGGGTVIDYWVIAYNVFDGSDSPHFPTPNDANCQWSGNTAKGCASGQGINGSHAYDVHHNVFRYLSNFVVTGNCHSYHDNLFEFLYSSFSGVTTGGGPQHPNVMNCLNGGTGENLYWYNNIQRHNFATTEQVYLAVRTNVYIFNNLTYDNMNTVFGIVPLACMRLNAAPNAAASQAAFIYNNTDGDGSCGYTFETPNAPLLQWNGAATFENNHFAGSASNCIGLCGTNLAVMYWCRTAGTCTINNNGTHVFQTTATATAQGYVTGNLYQPTTGGSTIGAGTNATASCPTFSSDSALCSNIASVIETAGSGGQIVSYPAITVNPRPSGGAWNSGAYQFVNPAPIATAIFGGTARISGGAKITSPP